MRGRKGHKMDRGGRAHRPRQGRETQTHKCLIFTEEKKNKHTMFTAQNPSEPS